MNPDFINSLTLEIDGVSVPKEKLLQYNRAESPNDGFSLTIAPNNAFGLNEKNHGTTASTSTSNRQLSGCRLLGSITSSTARGTDDQIWGSISYPSPISATFRTEVTYLLDVLPPGH